MAPSYARDPFGYATRLRRIVGIALLSTLALIVVLALSLWGLDAGAHVAQERSSRLERLRANILFLDEALTMSAQMAASSGQTRWEERYRSLEPELDRAIADARAGAGPSGRAAAARIEESNAALVAMENKAFDAVRDGNAAAAAAVLDGPEYLEQKAAYAHALAAFAEALGRESSGEGARADVYRRVAAVGLAVGISVAVVGWMLFVRAGRAAEEQYIEAHRRADRAEEAARRELTAFAASLEERVRERSAALAQRADEVLALARELETLEQRERRRLSDLLHDDVQQTLAAARLHVASGRHEVGVTLIDEALRATRALAREFAPPDDHEPLVAALSTLAEHFSVRHDLPVTLTAGSAPVVSGLVRDVVHSAVRELLFNIVKHASTSAARVIVRDVDGALEVRVEDGGRGFDPGTIEGGRGLHGVRGRIASLGGSVALESAPGEGTRVVLTVPAPRS